MSGSFFEYLGRKGVQIGDQGQRDIVAIESFEQQERTICRLEEQITKYRCEEIKNQKLIKTLQDKINQLAPSISDTGSNFMMASEFKSNFEEIMTASLPSAFGGIINRPYLFGKCFQDIFLYIYKGIEQKITIITSGICKLLNIYEQNDRKGLIENKIKISIIKILQQYWQKIVPIPTIVNLQYKTVQNNHNQILQELNQTLQTSDCLQLIQNLHKLMVYMIFQDKKWELVGLNSGEVVKFNKKQHVCMDGWIKEGANGLMMLSAIKRDGQFHANLKNFVIPIEEQDDQKEMYKNLLLFQKNQCQVQEKIEVNIAKEETIAQSTKLNEKTNFLQKKIAQQKYFCQQQTSILFKNKSIQLMRGNKENSGNYINKKSKKKDKIKGSLEASLRQSPHHRKRFDESLRHKKLNSEQRDVIEQKLVTLKQQMHNKKKHSTLVINKNINNSQEAVIDDIVMLPLKKKPLDDLPVSKEIPLRKKTKPATSRKNSVGKIVNQHQIIQAGNDLKDKQNCNYHFNATKGKGKQREYKEIIKEKMMEDKLTDKTQNSLTLLFPKSKVEGQKKKCENRPLKIQSNVNKLRQKYIY